jgi:hypothetical protein
MRKSHAPPKTQRKFGTIWGELDYVRKKIHYWWYIKKAKASAKRYLGRLERILEQLPEDNMAIIREEGLALLHELKGQRSAAIKHRRREIRLTERLHASVRESVQAGDYDESMAASILATRDTAVLEERRAILKALQDGQRSRGAHKQD